MPYTILPTASQSLGQTQPLINTNFTIIQTAFEINHVSFDASGEGKHKFLQMPEQTTLLDTAVNEAGFYAKVDPYSPTKAVLFFRQEDSGGGGGQEFQLTVSKTDDFASFGRNNPGWTFLPGGLILQFGTFTAAGGSPGQTDVTFPSAFSAVPYSLTTTINRDSSSSPFAFYPHDVTSTQFTFRSSASGAHPAYYMAIGPY